MRASDFDMTFQPKLVQYKTAARPVQSVDQQIRSGGQGQPVHGKLDMKVDHQGIQSLDSFFYFLFNQMC